MQVHTMLRTGGDDDLIDIGGSITGLSVHTVTGQLDQLMVEPVTLEDSISPIWEGQLVQITLADRSVWLDYPTLAAHLKQINDALDEAREVTRELGNM